MKVHRLWEARFPELHGRVAPARRFVPRQSSQHRLSCQASDGTVVKTVRKLFDENVFYKIITARMIAMFLVHQRSVFQKQFRFHNDGFTDGVVDFN